MKILLSIILLVSAEYAYAQQSRPFEALQSDTDIIFRTYPGGVKTDQAVIRSNGDAELKIANDGDCGIGNVCSGGFTPTTTAFNGTIGTCNQAVFTRVGDKVDVAFTCAFDVTTLGNLASFQLGNLPFVGGTFFPDSYSASGNCVSRAASGEDSNLFTVGTLNNFLDVVTSRPVNGNNVDVSCTASYIIP